MKFVIIYNLDFGMESAIQNLKYFADQHLKLNVGVRNLESGILNDL